MKKKYYPMNKLLERDDELNDIKKLTRYYNSNCDSETLSEYIKFLEYSKSLLESLSIESVSAIIHMDTILKTKFDRSMVVGLLDSILSDTPLKLLEYSAERQVKIQNYLLALRVAYIHDETLGNYRNTKYGDRNMINEHDPFVDFKSILGQALVAQQDVDTYAMGVAFSSMCSLAHELMVQGELELSLQLYEDILERQTMVLGEDHCDTMVTVIGICDVNARQGRGAEALRKFEQVVEQKKKQFGAYHPETLATLGALAYFMNSIKQPSK